MKNIKKVFLTILILSLALFIPNISQADTKEVYNEETLRAAVESANKTGDVIKLTANIALTRPLEITGKNLTIDGGNFTISRNAENWQRNGDNGSLITAGSEGTTLTLKNLNLRNADKYGAQSYNGAYLILDGVTISDSGFGGVIVNAGQLEIRNLYLGKNGSGENNGIELAKGNSVSTGDNKPTIIMNGTLSSNQTENVVYIAINDKLSGFDLVNKEGSSDKISMNGNRIVVTDPNNNVLFQSNEASEDLDISGEEYTPNVSITINLMDKAVGVAVMQGSTLTKEDLISRIDLSTLDLEGYTIDGFYTDEAFTTEYNFETAFNTDTTLYAKLSSEKDNTPKTGTDFTLELSMLIWVASTFGLITLTKKYF